MTIGSGEVWLAGARIGLVEPCAFRQQVLAAAASFSAADVIVNLCNDRHLFLRMFAAAMARRCTVLLPPSRAETAIAELRAHYPGCRVVDDAFIVADVHPPFAADSGDEDFVAAIGHTSGSTGLPAAHEKTLRALRTTTALNAHALRAELARQKSGDRPWIVATVPPQHMYGLETSVLLPLLEGFGVHCGRPLLPADVAMALSEVPAPRVLVSTPVHLRALVDSPTRYPEVSIVVSATAPLPPELATRIEQRLGAALIEFFGSTETCVIATRSTALTDRWRPYPGVRLVPGSDGTTVSAPWFVRDQFLHDLMELQADGSFTVVGRGSDVVEVAGKRASLADLTRRLLSLDGVVDAVVFQPPSRAAGTAGRCAALVVSPSLTSREISRRLRGLLDAAFVPRPLILVPELPRNELGKLPREKLLEILATYSASRPRRGT